MTQPIESPGRRLMARLDEFTAFTDDPPKLTRLYLSPAHGRAASGSMSPSRSPRSATKRACDFRRR
jgi:hypothetical protein